MTDAMSVSANAMRPQPATAIFAFRLILAYFSAPLPDRALLHIASLNVARGSVAAPSGTLRLDDGFRRIGQTSGGTISTYNGFGGKPADASRLYGSIGLRFGW